jgi:ubiquinone/menaquinone biosynthesis C-methylase UbiE/DNA-binding transcriptional ArsR family regulator
MNTLVFFKSLADETRIRLLNLLVHHELNVNEIVSVMSMGQSRVSRHLKILSDSGLLSWRRDGLSVFYRAADEGRGNELVGVFRELIKNDEVLRNDLDRLQELLAERTREKTRFFDSLAPKWDSIKNQLIDDMLVTGEIVGRLSHCRTAADLGCGTGRLLPHLKKKADRVIGVDGSPMMLEEARRRFMQNGGDIELRLGEIEHLPMRDGEADAAVINMVLHHLASPKTGIAEAGRILKRGDPLIIVDLHKHKNEEMRKLYGHRWLGFDPGMLKKWLEETGFRVAEVKEIDVKKGLKINLFLSFKE